MIKQIVSLIMVVALCSACSPEQPKTAQANEVTKKPFKKKVWDPAAVMAEMEEQRKEKARQKTERYLKLLSDIDNSNYILRAHRVTRVKVPTQHSEDELTTFNLIKSVYEQVMPRARLPEGAKSLVIIKDNVIEVIFYKAPVESNFRGRRGNIFFVDKETNLVIGTQIGLS